LKLYYDATDITVTEKPELEPWGMNPPPGIVVYGTLAASAELTRLREAIKEDEDLSKMKNKPFLDWTEEEMKASLEVPDEKVWDVFIDMSSRQLRYYKNELEKCDLRGDILDQYVFNVRLRIKELKVIMGKDAELRRCAPSAPPSLQVVEK